MTTLHLARRLLIPSLTLLTALTLGACRDDSLNAFQGGDMMDPPDMGVGDMTRADAAEDMGASDAAADMPAEEGIARPTSWRVLVSSEAPEAVRWSAQDVVEYFTQMGQQAELVESDDPADVACGDASQGTIAVLGEGLGDFEFSPRPPDQTWTYEESECEQGGALIKLAGRGLLGRQFAVYEWLHALGVRYFHPEQEYVPEQPRWPATSRMARQHTPDFTWRSVSLHLTHPLELGDIFELGNQDYVLEGKRYIDWQVKNGATFGHTGFGEGEYAEYGIRRGLPRQVGFPLHSQQQGDGAIVDPDDPRPPTEQIAEAIDRVMGDDPDTYPEFFRFTFNPSEFTEFDDEVSVAELTFIANYMKENYPDTRVLTTNHAVTGEPTDTYGVRYFDLSKFAPPNLGVQVHTVMFYDLFRPAPVYGNENFNYAYDFMVDQYQRRQIWHYPEASWWLTFDNALPLYLPITIEARDRDIQGISFMLQGKLDGHRVFGSGHEWGYWQNEYCPFRMAADLAYRYTDCIDDIASTTGERAAPVLRQALLDAINYQERDLIYGDILPYVIGTDPETEIATAVGIVFHPLPPSPQEIMAWDLEQVTRFEHAIVPALKRMDDDYARLIARLDAVRDTVPERGLPWFDEIYDGLEVTGLRARHGREVYGAAVMMRKSQILLDPSLAQLAADMLTDARATTQTAIEVIHRRELGYRYQPLSRSIGGGPEGAEDTNWTVYTYRYLNRTHYGYYYTRIDDLVQEALEGSGQVVTVKDAMITTQEQLDLRITDPEIQDMMIDFGDGEVSTQAQTLHSYGSPGVYTLRVTGLKNGQPFTFEESVAVVVREENLGFNGKIKQPEGTELIEPLLPAFVLGHIDAQTMVLGFSPTVEGDVPFGLINPMALDEDAQGVEFKSKPERLLVPVVNRATESVSTSLIVEGGTVERAAPGEALKMQGQLATDAIVSAVVSVGGFEEMGARRLVAAILGYTPSTLPSSVPFDLQYEPPAQP